MGSRGPLGTGEAARRNKPAVPTVLLPVSGRGGPAPVSPMGLGPGGERWWAWAWSTPQACAWSAGDVPFVARRADLEDEERTATVHRLMNEADDRLGLTPKSRARLGWRIVEDPPEPIKRTPRRRPQP